MKAPQRESDLNTSLPQPDSLSHPAPLDIRLAGISDVSTFHCLPLPFLFYFLAGSAVSWTLSQHGAKGLEPQLGDFSSSCPAGRGRAGPRGTPGKHVPGVMPH